MSRTPRRPLAIVVDIDERELARIEGHLTRYGVLTCPVQRAADAVALAQSFAFALAIVDSELPDASGATLSAYLRALDPGLAVVMTTHRFDHAAEVAARAAGIVCYTRKPLDLERLDLILDRVLSRGRGARICRGNVVKENPRAR